MKKLFVFAIAAGMFFVACNGGQQAATDSTATPAVDTMNAAPVAEPAPADSAATVDTAAATAPAADSAAAPAPAPAAH